MKKIMMCLLALLLATPVYADKQQKIEEFYKLNMNENTQKVFDNVYQMIMNPMICTLKMTAKDENDVKKQFMDIMDIQGMVKEMMPVYGKYYTEEELDEVLKFMKSPIGRKFMATMPQLSEEMMKISQEWLNKKAPQLKEMGRQMGMKYSERSEEEVEQCLKDKNIKF